MNITKKSLNFHCDFEDIQLGDLFSVDFGEYEATFMRIDECIMNDDKHKIVNAVCLDDGSLVHLHDDHRVDPLNGELIIEPVLK